MESREWVVETSELYDRREAWFLKKHVSALKAVHTNLDTAIDLLNDGIPPEHLHTYGHIRKEGNRGLLAIDQRGTPFKKLRETRLYVFPEKETRVLHLITINYKDTQQEDIKRCKKFISDLLKTRQINKETKCPSDITQ